MAELIKVNKKVINDPLFTPVIKFLQDRIAKLEVTGPADELALSKERYDGLVAGDLVIESAITFPDGAVRVCIISRKTGFARVDIDIKQVKMDDILTDFAVPLVEIEDVDHLKTYVKGLATPIQPTLLYLKEKGTYGVLVTQDQAKTHEGPMEAFGNLFFENYVTERESENSIDWETLESGTVTITDPSFGRGIYPLFIYELALSEAQLPEITSNLPASITSRRGESFVIPNTYWFSGTQDITTVATVELSTKSGYAILDRSSNLLEIDGETIYGSATEEINDQIVVRVVYDWNGRLVRKNFYIDLKIEKDLPNELTITCVPSDVTATSGDTIQVTMTAVYKGKNVEILIPPNALKSQTRRSNLTYVKTNKDFSMVYRGSVNATFPNTVDKLADLASGEFSYNDEGAVLKATGFVNIIIVKPETLPTFSVTGVPNSIQGYIDATGAYKPVIKYGDDVIPLSDIMLQTGVQGSKGLIDITAVNDDTGVNWKLIEDSQVPGQSIRDNFTQTYEWLDPRGVVQSKSFVIQVEVKLDSIIKIVPKPPQPRNVQRYQTGGPTWTLQVNGDDRNDLIRSVTVDPIANPDEQYIVSNPKASSQWMVLLASETDDVNYTANFTFTAYVDGKNQTFKFSQDFVIAKYVKGTGGGGGGGKPVVPPPVNDSDPSNPGGGPAPGETGTGPGGNTGPVKPIDPNDPSKGYEDDPTAPGGEGNPNSPGTSDDPNDPDSPNGPYNYDITAVPTSFTIGGNSDKNYQLTFKVYQGANDVTANAEIMADYTLTPDNVTFTSMTYNAQKNEYTVAYTKDKGGESTGAIFIKLKNNANPTKKEIARVWIDVDIQQIKILKVIDAPKSIALNVEESKDQPLTVEFSGKSIPLNDPNLTIEKQGDSPAKITNISETALTFLSDTWEYVGTTVGTSSPIKLTYIDPEDQKTYTVQFSYTISITYPPMVLSYVGGQDITAAIWDKGTFPIKLTAGDKDWTSAITRTVAVSGSKYISTSKLNWEVIFAEKTATSQIVGLNVYYTVGRTINQTLPADFKFNLAAWDGVTFATQSWTPETIDAVSGDKGEIVATFIYKGKDASATTVFDRANSTIPETVILGTPTYDAQRGMVIPYELTLGGDYPMSLAFTAPDNSALKAKIDIDTQVEWPNDLNIVSAGKDVRGYWNDTYSYPLVLNYKGTPVPLDDANLSLTFSSGDGDPIELTEAKATSLELLLVKGGDLGTSYDYTITIDLVYTNQASGETFSKEITVPATIRVPDVKVGVNPKISGNVFDTGKIRTTLVDERNRNVPIETYGVSGAGSNVMFLDPDQWYITNGSTTSTSQGTLPLRLSYQMGGVSRTIDVTEEFDIAKWDGILFKATTKVKALDGKGGDTGSIPFDFTYQGFPSEGVTLDLSRSTVPNNIAIGDLGTDNALPYTLSGQDTTTMELCFVRPGAADPMVAGRDYALVDFSVKTQSSNLPFTLVSNDDAITLDWGKTGVVKFVVKYGDNVVPNNAPGLVVKLKDADVHGIAIQSVSKDGITVKATRSDVAGSTKVYPESFLVSYEVGAPEPKTVSFDTNATVSMGPAAIINNDKVNVAIWGTGTFRQAIQFNDVTLNTIDHFEIRGGVDNKYIDVKGAKGYEVIGAELTTTTQSIPMTVYYTVDGTSVLQKLDFDASFQITGSSSVRFKVNVSPTKIEGSLNNESQITCTPIYKDKPVGGAATFKPDLSTIPKELTLKDYKVVNNSYVITFVGATGGVDVMTLVFWSPDAGTAPKDRDVAKVDVDVKVMGELGIEIGTRDNLITGTNGDKGTYRFQILFGGIPIDAAAEIANGNLTAVREAGASSSMNANVVKIDKWNAASYDYSLVGCVQPNATVNVSDFINLTYKYGGQTFTRRVEIPLKYTSDIPTFGGWPTAALKVFSKSTLSPTAVSGGVSVASGIASISNWGDTDDTYITLGGSAKTYEVIWGEKTEITHLVHARVIGQYRQWTWSAEIDIPFTIAAWDQRTWNPITDTVSWETFLGLNGNALGITINESAQYKAQQYVFPGFANLDTTRTDLGGLVTARYIGNANANRFQQYALSSSKVGQYQGKFCWLRPGAPTPGVENMDYAYSDFAINIKQNSLVADSVARLAGGNNDVVTGSLVIRLNSDKSQIQNTNANLVIATVNEDVFKITSKAASTITVQITAPYTTADGPVDVPMTFTYTDPNTGYVTTGTFNYPVTLRRPADWPVVTQTTTSPLYRLYDYGPNPFKITVSGTDVTSQVIPIACDDTVFTAPGDIEPPYMEMSLNDPVQGTWFWVTKTLSVSQTQTRSSYWTIRVPYRGTTVDVKVSFTWRLFGGTSATEFYIGNQQTKFLLMNPGDRITLPFEIKYRTYKYGQAEFVPDYQIPGWTPFSTDFTFISQSYDDSTGFTSLTFEAKNVVARPVPFPFKYKGATDLVLNKNVAYGVSSSYQLTLTDVKNNAWTMWDQRALSTLVTIADGSTVITGQCKIIGVNNPLWTILNPTGNNTTIQLKSSEAVPAQNVDLKLQIQLPATYFNAVIEMTLPSTIAEYDGNEFVITLRSAPSWPSAAVGNIKQVVCYFDTYFRGQRVSAGSMATSVRSTTVDMRNANKDVEGGQGLLYGGISYATPSNLVYITFSNTLQMTGKLILPFTYFGAGSTDYPVGTKGKNYTELDIGDAGFYENKLYLYPSDKELTQVEGAYNARVPAPMVFTVGKDFPNNAVNPSTSGMTWNITDSSLTGVVSKPTTQFSSTTGISLQIDYDNRGDDVVVDVPIRMNFNNSTYRGVGINSDYNLVQKVLIKGSKAGDTITTTPTVYTNRRVWEVLGPALTITQNGKTISASQIKDIQIAANPYIRRPESSPNFTGRWFEIYNGKTDGPTNTVATFTVTYNDGIKDVTVTQDVAINIQQYSGSPWNVVPVAVGTQASVDLKYVKTGPVAVVGNLGYFYLQVYYKNAILTEATAATYAMSTADIPGQLPGFASLSSQAYYYIQSGNVNAGPSMMMTVRAGADDTLIKKQGRIKFGFKDKVDDPTSVQGQDWVYVDIETLTYLNNNKWYIVSQDVTEFTSKFTNPVTKVKITFTARVGNVFNTIGSSNPYLTNQGNLSVVLNESDRNSVVTVAFTTELTSQKQQTLDTVIWVGAGNSTNSAQAIVKATQISNYDFPTISNVNSVNAVLNQTGGIPFTIKDDSGNDITSTASISGISSNNYIQRQSGSQWLCYNTRSADTEILITFSYQITYKGNLLQMKQDVPFVIKAYTDQPSVSNVQVVNAKVWDIGSVLPFTINISGNPVPASWITGVTGTAANSRVQVTSAAEPWYIAAGSKDGPVSDTVSYTVTVNNGYGGTWTVKQDVVFNIAKYDGIELVGKILTSGGGNINTQSVFYPYNATSFVGIVYQLYSKGRLVTNPAYAGSAAGPENTILLGATTNGASQFTINMRGTGNANQNTRTSMTVKIKIGGSAGTTEGIDVVTMVTPVFMVSGTGQLLVHPRTTTAMSGKYGTPVSLDAFIIKYLTESSSTFVDLTTGSTTVAFAPTDVISLVANSFTPQGYKVNFVNQLYVDTVKDVTVTLTNGGVSTKYVLNTTQLASDADKPTVTNLKTTNGSINQTGGIPFNLVDPDSQQDVTSAARIASINTNSYVELVDGKWRVKTDVTAETHTNVTFNLLMNYRGKDIQLTQVVDFLIKPFDGKFVITAVPDITANVWDRGTVIPLTISVNGNPMPASWITGYTTSPTDPYVTVAADGSWQITAGSKDAAIVQTVGYAVNVAFPGGTTAQAVANVKYNIGKYDGVEFKLSITNLNIDGVLLIQAGLDARANLTGYYRGDVISGTGGFATWSVITSVNLHPTTPVKAISVSGATKIYDFGTISGGIVRAQNVVRFTRPGGKTDATAVEGVDYVNLVVPITAWQAGVVIVGQTPSVFEGKLGDVLTLRGNIYYGGNRWLLNAAYMTITPNASLGIEVVPGSVTENSYQVRFTKDVSADTDVSSNINYQYNNNQIVGNTTSPFRVIQHPKPAQPDVKATGTMQPVEYGETGQIVLTGTVGSDALAGKVTFVPGSSDAKGLVQFGTPTTGNDGTVIIPVTGVKVGKDNLTIHITVNGATGNTSGKDYLDVIVEAEVTYGELGEGDGFESDVTGTSGDPVTVTQWIYVPE